MKYKFDFKIQAAYGLFGFAISSLVIYLFTKKWDGITPTVIGIMQFAVSGYFTSMKKC